MNITEKALAYAEQQGAVICNAPNEKKRLAKLIIPVAAVFSELVSRLAGVYPYYMRDQGGDLLPECDGISWKYHDNQTGSTVFLVGISIDGMDAGAEYAAFLFLHELAHTVTGPEHNTAFHDQLNSMIKAYNQANGTNIINDLFDWPSRHDYRPYNPFGAVLYTRATESR